MTQSPPDAETLRKFALGDLPPAEWDRVARYLEANPQSPDTLVEPAAEDTFVSALRAAPGDAPADSPELLSIIDAAAKLVPDVATAMFAQSVSIPFEPTAEYVVPPKPGERLGRFRIERVLGRGGMGVVYAAADEQLDRRIALKVMAPQLAANPVAKERFLREARTAAQVEHDNIVPILEVGEDRGIPFMAMPMLRGRTLDERLAEGTPDLDEALAIARGTVDGLAAAHDRGLIHRDIKPSNLWLETNDDGTFRRVRLLDFGLARQETDADRVTKSGTILGTPAYMAPEQARGDAVDARADLFSLGCVLYRMATGQNAFRGSDTYSLLTSLAMDRPKAPSELNADIPRPLSDLIMSLLEKDAKRRPANARAVRDRLAAVANAVPASAPRRGRALPIATIALSLIGLVGVLFGGTIVRIATNKGELVVEVNDDNVEIVVKQDGAIVVDKTKNRRFVLTAKDGEIEFLDPDTGVTTQTKAFRLTRGGVDRVVARIDKTERSKQSVTTNSSEFIPSQATRQAEWTAEQQRSMQWVLEKGGSFCFIVDGKQVDVARIGDPIPKGMRTIENLTINNIEREGFSVHELKNLPTVSYQLSIADPLVSEDNLTRILSLSSIRGVKYLSLNHPRTSDGVFPSIVKLNQLHTLSIWNRGFTINAIKQIAGMSNLTTLYLTKIQLTSPELKVIATMDHLQRLHFDASHLTDGDLASIIRMNNIDDLYIRSAPFSFEALASLADCKTLKRLRIEGSSLTNEQFQRLATAMPRCQIVWPGGVIEPKSTLTPSQRQALEALLARGGHLGFLRADQPIVYVKKGETLPTNAGALYSIAVAMLDTDTPATILGILEQLPPGLKSLNMHYMPFTGADLEKLVAMPNLAGLESLAILNWKIVDNDLRHLRNLTKLKSVSVNFTPTITAAGIAHLRGLPLESLQFQECSVDDTAIDTILSFRDLQELGILNSKITAKGLARLPELTKLYNVSAGGPSATEASLRELARCPTIGEFNLVNFPIPALAILAKFPKLQVLSLDWNTSPTPEALAAVGTCPRLRKVHLYGKSVTAEHAKALAVHLPATRIDWPGGVVEPKMSTDAERALALWALARGDRVALAVGENIVHPKTDADLPKDAYSVAEAYLANAGDADLAALAPLWRTLPRGRERTLHITGPITNAGLGSLRGCPIVQLGLNRVAVTDEGLPALAEITGLNRLQFDGTRITDAGLAALAKCPNLVHVDLLNTAIGDAGLNILARLPHLHSLTLTNTTTTAAGLDALAQHAKLQQLTVSGTVGKDAKALGTPLGRMATLRTLNVSTSTLADADVKALSAAPIALLRLSSSRLTDQALDHLAAMKSLETLHLEANPQLSGTAVQKLAAALPACRIHWTGGVIKPTKK